MDVREAKAKALIKSKGWGRNHEQQCCVNLSMFLGRKEKAMNSSLVADPLRSVNAGSPHCRPAIQCLCNSQNVAGLWLKYGAKSLKSRTSSRCKKLSPDATICRQQPLTMPIGGAYKPPTERGAVLAHGQGMFSCP